MKLANLFCCVEKMEDELISELDSMIQEVIGHDDFDCWAEKGVLYLEIWKFPLEDFTEELTDLSEELGFKEVRFA